MYVKDARTLIVDRAGVTGEVRLGDVIIPPGEETAATEMIIVGESAPHPERAAQEMKFRQCAPACRMGVRIVRIPSAALTVILFLAAVIFTMLVAIAMR
ncbi:MAG TPA: hypothetical protein VGJ82_06875 [Thermoanaerobaculia bacterium]